MTSAISASTLTTIAVFIPLAFVSGIVGLLFKQLAFVASITIAASLLVSLSLAPMLSSVLMKRKIKEKKHGFLYNISEKLFVFVENLYKSLLGLNIRFRWFVVIAVAAVFFFTVKAGLSTGTDYIPEFDMGDIVATAELESSVDAEQSEAVAKKIEEIVKRNVDEKDLRTYYTITGQTDNGLLSMFGFSEGKNIATIMAKIVNRNQRSYHIKTVATKIRKEVEEIPEVVSFNMTAGSLLQSAMLGSSKPIEIKIKGNDLKKLAETGDKLQKVLEEQPYLQDVESTVDRGKPEVTVKFDRVKLARLGINAGMAALAVRESLYGADSGNYKQDNDEYDIVIRYDKEKRSKISDLKNIMLTSASGELIPLSAVGIIEETDGPTQILHETQQRIVYLKLTLNDISLGEATKNVMEIIKNEEIDPDVYIELGGQVVDQQSTFGDMKLLFLLSLFLIYAIMASQFESLRDPFIIMFTVPLSIIGVIWAFILTGTTLSAVTFVGIIMLLGIVVNNGIVLVDYTNLLRGRGYTIIEAIKEGGRSRLRPVLMTAITTIIGMFPMALNNGAGSEIWKPLGITVIGGLTVATLVTLLLIPAIYAIMHTREMIKEAKTAKAEAEGGAK